MPVISCTILILSIEWLIKNKINVVILMIFLLTFYFINLTKSFHRQNLENINMTLAQSTSLKIQKFLLIIHHKKNSKRI